MTGNTPPHESGTVSVGRFEFDRGGTVPELELAYEQYGTYDPDGGPKGEGNAVLVCHALTGSQHVASTESEDGAAGQASAWWDGIVGPGKAIDTTEYAVICVNVPGSCYGSTGPASEHPDGGRWGSAFPPVTVPDWTRAQRRLLQELGIDSLHAVVGGSVGGMNALDWVRQFPDEVARVAPVATAPRLDAQLLGINGVARRAIRGDPNWQGGDYYGDAHPDHGLMLARQLGHVTYLSKSSMSERFGREPTEHTTEEPFPKTPGSDAFPYRSVESYLDHQAASFVDRFDANSYLWLTRAMDEFDLATGVEDDAAALSGFDGDALVLSFTGDWHFTVDDAAGLARAFDEAGAAVAHHVVDSDYGHDAFLVEDDAVGPPLRDFFEAGVDGDAVEHVDCSEAEALGDDACGDDVRSHPAVRSD